MIDDRLIPLAERRFHARPMSAEDAREALEWVAAREGKTLMQLLDELDGTSADTRPAVSARAPTLRPLYQPRRLSLQRAPAR